MPRSDILCSSMRRHMPCARAKRDGHHHTQITSHTSTCTGMRVEESMQGLILVNLESMQALYACPWRMRTCDCLCACMRPCVTMCMFACTCS